MSGTGDQPITWLMFFTLAAAVVIVAGAFIFNLRSRTNRAIAERALEGKGVHGGKVPDGAAPELIGFAVIALAVMGLLTAGYHARGNVRVASGPSVQTTGMSQQGAAQNDPQSNGMAQPTGIADQPKKYQPANPAPDTRGAPAQSDTGIGPANGSGPAPKQ